MALGLTSATSSSKPWTHVLPAVCLPGKHQLRTRTSSRKNVGNKGTYRWTKKKMLWQSCDGPKMEINIADPTFIWFCLLPFCMKHTPEQLTSLRGTTYYVRSMLPCNVGGTARTTRNLPKWRGFLHSSERCVLESNHRSMLPLGNEMRNLFATLNCGEIKVFFWCFTMLFRLAQRSADSVPNSNIWDPTLRMNNFSK